jgi:6-pyruvoyltetrahydropterin/6-carboxytetrahydropterin synthase
MKTKPLTPTVTRILEFDAGHRVFNHESKCATLHGHRYKVEITAQADRLDKIGRVIDFSVLKNRIGSWLDEHWDHNVILFIEDKVTINAVSNCPRQKDPFVAMWNPTAENMAEFLLREVCPVKLRDTNVLVTKVVVWETPNCKAEATLGELIHQ